MNAPNSKLQKRTYSISGLSFTPNQLANEIRLYVPNFSITYEQDQKLQSKGIYH